MIDPVNWVPTLGVPDLGSRLRSHAILGAHPYNDMYRMLTVYYVARPLRVADSPLVAISNLCQHVHTPQGVDRVASSDLCVLEVLRRVW